MHPHDRRVPRPRRHRPLAGKPGGTRLAIVDRAEIGTRGPGARAPCGGASVTRTSGHCTDRYPVSARNTAHTDSPNGLLGKNPPGPFLDPSGHRAIREPALRARLADADDADRRRRSIARSSPAGGSANTPSALLGSPTVPARSTSGPRTGGSDQFLKGKLDMTLFPPADPTATPTPGNPYANQLTGIVGLFNQNLLQSGGVLVLDHLRPEQCRIRPTGAAHQAELDV